MLASFKSPVLRDCATPAAHVCPLHRPVPPQPQHQTCGVPFGDKVTQRLEALPMDDAVCDAVIWVGLFYCRPKSWVVPDVEIADLAREPLCGKDIRARGSVRRALDNRRQPSRGIEELIDLRRHDVIVAGHV